MGRRSRLCRCISLFSYIKPQLPFVLPQLSTCCISLFSYIKPQLIPTWAFLGTVVYLCFPTSNRNHIKVLSQNTKLYIFVFLHQTATPLCRGTHEFRCISLFSYIKPQLLYQRREVHSVVYLCFPTSNRNKIQDHVGLREVVYLCFPTSNRNYYDFAKSEFAVVYLCFPTSNRNLENAVEMARVLYIFVFLHQTATFQRKLRYFACCISLFSYIKPQLRELAAELGGVVYLCFPTSNRNLVMRATIDRIVVYLCFPTSNRNYLLYSMKLIRLYIFVFLHQTATRI